MGENNRSFVPRGPCVPSSRTRLIRPVKGLPDRRGKARCLQARSVNRQQRPVYFIGAVFRLDCANSSSR